MPQTPQGARGAGGFDPSIDPRQQPPKTTAPANLNLGRGSKPPLRWNGIRIVLTILLVGIIVVCVASILRGPNVVNTNSDQRRRQEIAGLEQRVQVMRRERADTRSIEIDLNKLKDRRATLESEMGRGITPVQRQSNTPMPILIALTALVFLILLWRKSIFRPSHGSTPIKGIARSVTQRTESYPGFNQPKTVQVLTFKMEI